MKDILLKTDTVIQNAHLSPILKLYREEKCVTITAAEIALTQISKIRETILGETGVCELYVDINDLSNGQDTLFKSAQMIRWTWMKALMLIRDLNGFMPETSFKLALITNDFVVEKENRALARRLAYQYFPNSLIEIAEDLGFDMTTDEKGVVLKYRGKTMVVEHAFEAYLRNKAIRRRKNLLNKKDIEYSENNSACIILDADRVSLKSDDQFTIHSGDSLELYNEDKIPVCNSIILSHFLNHKENAIINVADYDWKCGYRGGAIGIYNMTPYKKPIINILYTLPIDEASFLDVFDPQNKL